jgi:hypothetical protein
MLRKVSIIFFLIFTYIIYEQSVGKNLDGDFGKSFAQTVVPQKEDENCSKLNFHFLEISNAQYTSVSRQVEIFLDEKAFSEKNLKILFEHLSAKYSDTKRLVISVSTNWEQLPLPFDCSPGANGLSDTSDQKPVSFKYHQARFFKDEKVEYFIYYPILNTEKFKRVILKDSR